MSLKYEPSSEPLHIFVKYLFLNCHDVNAGDGVISPEELQAVLALLGKTVSLNMAKTFIVQGTHDTLLMLSGFKV